MNLLAVSLKILLLSYLFNGASSLKIKEILKKLFLPPNCNQSNFVNWAQDILVDGLYTAYPTTTSELLSLAAWAAENKFHLRPSNQMHNWSPITIPNNSNITNYTLLVKTQAFNNMKILSKTSDYAYAWVEAGATMNQFLAFLEHEGFGFTNVPAPGDISVGGAIAIGGHGTSIPRTKEEHEISYSFGCLSNSIIAITAVVYDRSNQNYTLKKFARNDPDISSFLVNLGKAFIVDVTFQVLPNQNLRCVSLTNISSAELFADPTSPTFNESMQTFAKLMNSTGRIEIIQYPYTNYPWIKLWSVVPPLADSQLNQTVQMLRIGSLKVNSPYNYPFSDILPSSASQLLKEIINGETSLTPQFGQVMLNVTRAGLVAFGDIWGPSKNVLNYIKPTTMRVTANGFAILTIDIYVQKAMSKIMNYYYQLIADYQNENIFPINGPVEIRVTGLDTLTGLPEGSQPANIGALTLPENVNFNVAIWFDILTYPGTPSSNELYTKMQSFLMMTFNGTDGILRPEWSKGWAYTNTDVYTNMTIIQEFPKLYPNWNKFVGTLKDYDPDNIYTNDFLNTIFQ